MAFRRHAYDETKLPNRNDTCEACGAKWDGIKGAWSVDGECPAPVKRIPISAAKRIADDYGQNQVIVVTFDKRTGLTHVVTYGKSVEECEQAAQGGNLVKHALGWPESLCNAKPARARRRRAAAS